MNSKVSQSVGKYMKEGIWTNPVFWYITDAREQQYTAEGLSMASRPIEIESADDPVRPTQLQCFDTVGYVSDRAQ